MTGVVSQIQDFSVHDGDGIRTTIFLSGCPLRCRWCSNPETWGIKPVVASHASRCTDCGRCLQVCPAEGALDLVMPHHVNPAQCTLCGKCVAVCPSAAKTRMGGEMSVSEVVGKVMRNNIFFQASGGGVTFSGGEATFQADYFNRLVREFYDLGVHLALETSGFFEWDEAAESLMLMDHIFYDLKLMDSEKHLEMTGQDNGRILENFRRLASLGVDVVVRIPVISGVNEDEANIEATALFVSEVLPRAAVELLPYHAYGNYKYEALNLGARLYVYETPSEARMEALRALVEKCGVKVVSYK